MLLLDPNVTRNRTRLFELRCKVAKMKFFVLFSMVACVSSVPILNRILLCVNYNLDDCVSVTYDIGQCVNLPSELLGTLSSEEHELDMDEHYCTLYQSLDCTGDSYQVDRLNTALTNFNDRASSFLCTS